MKSAKIRDAAVQGSAEERCCLSKVRVPAMRGFYAECSSCNMNEYMIDSSGTGWVFFKHSEAPMNASALMTVFDFSLAFT
ncbi:MAG: hypothetical protein U5R06_16370 [candidate division KSB1 bacterium]|nr:hypothetical protein [candidate division KSB1 bacterium]